MGTKQLYDEDIDEFLYDCVQVEPMALQEEFVRVSSDLAYWSAKYSLAYKQKLLSEVRRKQITARQYFAIKEQLIKDIGKAIQKDVDHKLELDEEVQKAKAEEIEAEFEKERLKGILNAITSKRDMLISVGAQIRAEMAQDPFINKR